MNVERVWAMPHRYTFRVPVIAAFLAKFMNPVACWVDPFCGPTSPALVRNDLDTSVSHAHSHTDGLLFLQSLVSASTDGVLFDPPYSAEQALRVYHTKYKGRAGWAEYIAKCHDEIGRIVKPGGHAITFGWNSNGIGKRRGFALTDVLLVAHGACHPMDTIVTHEVKGGG